MKIHSKNLPLSLDGLTWDFHNHTGSSQLLISITANKGNKLVPRHNDDDKLTSNSGYYILWLKE